MTKIKCICEHCGKDFYKNPSQLRGGRGKYCSRECFILSEHKRVIIVCEQCGEKFEVKVSRAKKHHVGYCSKTCQVIAQKSARIKCICGQCCKEFYRTVWQVHNGVGKYCSRKCQGIALSARTGDKGIAWKGKTVKRICATCGREFISRPVNKRPLEGKYCSNECRYIGKKGQMVGESNPMYGKVSHAKGAWFALPDGDKIWLRSSYEIRVVQALIALGVQWQYEPKAFHLNGTSYHPDFLINNAVWWEVKGFMRSIARDKILKFMKYYPNEQIKMIGQREIEQIEYHIKNNLVLDLALIGTDLDHFEYQAHYLP